MYSASVISLTGNRLPEQLLIIVKKRAKENYSARGVTGSGIARYYFFYEPKVTKANFSEDD